jgi:helicase MOV-10
VLVGDSIFVRETKKKTGPWYEGYVHSVELDKISLKFNAKFQPILRFDYFISFESLRIYVGVLSKKPQFDVRFSISRIPLRRQHQALDLIKDPQYKHVRTILFPDAPPEEGFVSRADNEVLVPFNRNILGNPEQTRAVLSILHNRWTKFPIKIVFGRSHSHQ